MCHQPIAAGKSSFNLVDHETLFNCLALKDDTVFLDLACGTGRYALEAAKSMKSGIVYAVDLWPEGISALMGEIVRQRVHPNIWATVADATRRLPLLADTVDVCLLATVLHDFYQEGTANTVLGEIKRILKPSGSLAVVEFKAFDPPPGPPRSIRLSAQQVDQILAPLGFCKPIVCEVGPRLYLAKYRIEK